MAITKPVLPVSFPFPSFQVIQRHFDPMDKLRYFGVSADWVGAGSSLRLDRLWTALDRRR